MNTIWEDFKNAFNRPNNGLLQLIYINVVIFVLVNVFFVIGRISDSDLITHLPLSILALPGDFQALLYKPWTLIAYFFTQQGIFHILSNMLGLYFFGRIIDDLIGNDRLIGIYVTGGLAGGLAYILAYNFIPPDVIKVGSPLIGASGSVFAIAVAAATLAPDYRFNLVFLGPVKIAWLVAAFIFISVIGTIGRNSGGNFAHLGGALMGYIFITQLRNGNELARPVIATMDFFKSLFKKNPKIKVSYRNTDKKSSKSSKKSDSTSSSTPASTDEISQREIDEILDKISQSGYDSLTKEEKRKLFSASQKK